MVKGIEVIGKEAKCMEMENLLWVILVKGQKNNNQIINLFNKHLKNLIQESSILDFHKVQESVSGQMGITMKVNILEDSNMDKDYLLAIIKGGSLMVNG